MKAVTTKKIIVILEMTEDEANNLITLLNDYLDINDSPSNEGELKQTKLSLIAALTNRE